MLTIYDWDASPNCFKTKILLLELGVPFEQKNVDKAFLQSAEYRTKFPSGLAPAIEDGDVRISESSAIALYLAEKHDALAPKDPSRRALMFQALALESALLAPTVGGQGLFGELYKPKADQHEPRIAFLKQRAQEVAAILGKVLGDRTYFAGDFSIADIQLFAATTKSLESGVFGDAPKNLVAWQARIDERPSVVKAREQYVSYKKR